MNAYISQGRDLLTLSLKGGIWSVGPSMKCSRQRHSLLVHGKMLFAIGGEERTAILKYRIGSIEALLLNKTGA